MWAGWKLLKFVVLYQIGVVTVVKESLTEVDSTTILKTVTENNRSSKLYIWVSSEKLLFLVSLL